MLDKLIELAKSQVCLKRVCIFFLAFAASLVVMGSSHDIIYGNGVQLAPEKAHVAQSGASEQEDGINREPVLYGQAGQEFADGLMPAAKTTKLEEIVTSAVANKTGSTKVESKLEDEEDADDEANAGETAATKKKAETEESAENVKSSEFVYSEKIPMSLELQQFTYAKCEERGLEYELVLAIIWRESGFNADAVNVNSNGTRDNGIMQINDINREWLKDKHGITDLMDPFQNIDAGTAMLGNLTSKYGPHNALLAYQYGEGGMARRLKQGITTSTAIEKAYKQRDYYRKII